MRLTKTTPPVLLPVDLESVKRRLDGYSGADIDELIGEKIRAATEYLEEITWRTFLETTYTLSIDYSFPAVIFLPRPPYVSLTSITYTDENGDSTVLASSKYEIKYLDEIAIVQPVYNTSWPATRFERDAISIIYKAGYGDERREVPYQLRDAVSVLAAHLVRQSWGSCEESRLLPRAVSDLVSNFRVMRHEVLQCL